MLASELRDNLRWRAIALSRSLGRTRVARSEWEALSAWTGLVHQAYQADPLQANLCSSPLAERPPRERTASGSLTTSHSGMPN